MRPNALKGSVFIVLMHCSGPETLEEPPQSDVQAVDSDDEEGAADVAEDEKGEGVERPIGTGLSTRSVPTFEAFPVEMGPVDGTYMLQVLRNHEVEFAAAEATLVAVMSAGTVSTQSVDPYKDPIWYAQQLYSGYKELAVQSMLEGRYGDVSNFLGKSIKYRNKTADYFEGSLQYLKNSGLNSSEVIDRRAVALYGCYLSLASLIDEATLAKEYTSDRSIHNSIVKRFRNPVRRRELLKKLTISKTSFARTKKKPRSTTVLKLKRNIPKRRTSNQSTRAMSVRPNPVG